MKTKQEATAKALEITKAIDKILPDELDRLSSTEEYEAIEHFCEQIQEHLENVVGELIVDNSESEGPQE